MQDFSRKHYCGFNIGIVNFSVPVAYLRFEDGALVLNSLIGKYTFAAGDVIALEQDQWFGFDTLRILHAVEQYPGFISVAFPMGSKAFLEDLETHDFRPSSNLEPKNSLKSGFPVKMSLAMKLVFLWVQLRMFLPTMIFHLCAAIGAFALDQTSHWRENLVEEGRHYLEIRHIIRTIMITHLFLLLVSFFFY